MRTCAFQSTPLGIVAVESSIAWRGLYSIIDRLGSHSDFWLDRWEATPARRRLWGGEAWLSLADYEQPPSFKRGKGRGTAMGGILSLSGQDRSEKERGSPTGRKGMLKKEGDDLDGRM